MPTPAPASSPAVPAAPAVVVGIAGGTGSGKTTIARALVEQFDASEVVYLQHDAYYRDRPDLSPAERAAQNYDHPDAIENELLIEQLDALRAGRAVRRPQYDFVHHRRCPETVLVTPAPLVILEGILLFADERICARCAIKVFVDTPADVRILRRIRRDMKERGRQFEDIRQQYYDTVRPMHEAFVEPTRRLADLIVPEGGGNRAAIDVIAAGIRGALLGRAWGQASSATKAVTSSIDV